MSVKKYKVTDHFDGRKFYNQEPHTNNARDFFKFILNRKKVDWPDQIEVLKPDIQAQVSNNIKVTYINHATLLVQVDGVNILTDPIWSARPSPVKFLGPKRIHAPGIAFNDLPQIDIVLISHDHYDHLDVSTVKKLQKKHKPLFITGLKVGKCLRKINRNINFIELDWWEYNEFNSVKLHFVPAHHWSSRKPFVRNDTLWGGFVIESTKGSVYFAGDTGWGKHFEQIADRFNNIQVSLLPIGAYLPRWFMKYSHISPEEAVQAHKILGTKFSIGIHFNCFKNLADDEFNEAIMDLESSLAKHGVKTEAFAAPKPGQEFLV